MGLEEDVVSPQPTEEEEKPEADAVMTQNMDFVTFGMFIIDDIEYLPPKPPVKDIVGGAGSFSALGARLFSPPPLSATVGWVVDKGSDFPDAITTLIDSWQTSAVVRADPGRLTTRGWNGYVDASERRDFRYLTPKKRLEAADLTPALLGARAFHIVSSPTRCRDLVAELLARRRAELPPGSYARPLIVWEPVPDLCTPAELLNCTNTLPVVDVCSPNHAELAAFMGDAGGGLDPATGEISTGAVERACEQLLASMPLSSFALVVRAGERGCYVARNGGRKKRATPGKAGGGAERRRRKDYVRGGLQPDTDMEALFAGLLQGEDGTVALEEIEADPGVERWIPAYHAKPAGAVRGEKGKKGSMKKKKKKTAPEPAAESEGKANEESADGPPDGEEAREDGRAEQEQGQEEHGDAEEEDDDNTADDHQSRNSKVVDPTGGGNTFLGGLAVAMARGKSVEEAAVWGAVAASFAIEQVGVPVLGADAEGNETWNGVRVGDRLRAFQERIGAL